jgi:uncharacterized protein (TIGR03067 family)
MKIGILILSLLFATGQAAQVPAPAVTDQIQGSWAIASFNGQEVPADAGAFLVFTKDKYEQWTGGVVDERGSFKIDASKKPMTLDLIITEGESAGKTQFGVFELTGDTMLASLAMPGDTVRPASISQGELQVVMKKSK